MDEIVEQGKRENWTPEQYRNALDKLLSDERQRLRRGEVELNKAGAERDQRRPEPDEDDEAQGGPNRPSSESDRSGDW
jgi:hypothetical protein